MAIKLTQKTPIVGPSTDHPYGQIQDEASNQPGTPVDRYVYHDHHIFFQRLMDLAGITFNNQLDKISTGFQLMEAFMKLTQDEFAGSVYPIQQQVNTTGNEIVLDDRFLNVINVSNPNALDELTHIYAPEHKEGDYVILIFGEGHSIGGAIDDWALFLSNINGDDPEAVLPNFPYVFRLGQNKDWYLESAAGHLKADLDTKADKSTPIDLQDFDADTNSGLVNDWQAVGSDVGFWRDDKGYVNFEGRLEKTATNTNYKVCELPVTYWPTYHQYFTVFDKATLDAFAAEITTGGDFSVITSDPVTQLQLSNIQYIAQ